jgi:hypothetical protein
MRSQPRDRRTDKNHAAPTTTMHTGRPEIPEHRTDKKPAKTDTKPASLHESVMT